MKNGKELTTLGMWIVEFGDDSRRFKRKSDVFPYLSELVRQHPSGRAVVDEDVGGRSWFLRFVFGLHPRFLQMHFTIEWSSEVASLIFLDDAASEYRAKDTEKPILADEATRKTIAHGEVTPHPLEQCMSLGRTRQAIDEYLKTGVRPEWLQYEYVA